MPEINLQKIVYILKFILFLLLF